MPVTLLKREMKSAALREMKLVGSGDEGIFEGYLAVFENVDGQDDLIQRGAFKKTLQEHETKRRGQHVPFLMPLLWNHHEDQPIGGILDAHEDEVGLYVRCQIDLDNAKGREVFSGVKMGYINTMSIGYDAIKRVMRGAVRVLQELKLWEGSVVTFPANPLAAIDTRNVKSASGATDWPLGSRTAAWSNAQATKRIEAWANGDSAKLASVHFWHDPSGDATTISAYKLLFCDVVSGAVTAMPRAIFACAAALQGSRGGVSIPSGDKAGVEAKVTAYYTKMAAKFDDASIAPPWKDGKSMSKKPKASKAVDFAGALASRNNDLQDQWADQWRALVYAIASVMWDDSVTDKKGAAATIVEQFSSALDTLIGDSQAAEFCPCLDDDGDSFADPDDQDDDQPMGMMRSSAEHETKKGAAISAANLATMGKALDHLDAGHKNIAMAKKALRDMYMVAIGDPPETDPAGNDDPQDRTDSARITAKSRQAAETEDTDLQEFRAWMETARSGYRVPKA